MGRVISPTDPSACSYSGAMGAPPLGAHGHFGQVGLLAAFLDVRLDELFGVVFQHLVDLVQEVVKLGL